MRNHRRERLSVSIRPQANFPFNNAPCAESASKHRPHSLATTVVISQGAVSNIDDSSRFTASPPIMPTQSGASTTALPTDFVLKPDTGPRDMPSRSLWGNRVEGLIMPEGRTVQTPTGSRVYPYNVPQIEVVHKSSGMGFAVKSYFDLFHQALSKAPPSSSEMCVVNAGVEFPIIHYETEQECQAIANMIEGLRTTMSSEHARGQQARRVQINAHVDARDFNPASRLLSVFVRTAVQACESKWEANGWGYCEIWEPGPDSKGETSPPDSSTAQHGATPMASP